MDFPPYYIDHIAGGRLIIGLIASIHVLINHPLAVGAYPILTWMEWWAHKHNRPDIDRLAYRITAVVFIVTTTVGALTGVGIWVSTSVFAPFGIGSLLRVFFWGWFAEWLVFISEVCLIMWWFLSWKKAQTPEQKKKHIRIGIALSVMSWFTMALIVAVLGFMMKPGDWSQTRAFIDAMVNPLYLPQLGFRTFFALMTGAVFVWFCSFFYTKGQTQMRQWLVYRLSHFTLVGMLLTLIFGLWYWQNVPDAMKANSSVAVLTQEFMGWYDKFSVLLGWTLISFLVIAVAGLSFANMIPRWALLIPSFMGIWLLGHFERAREFMRKPWVIGDYMYSNGVRKDELAFLQSEGILKHATYVAHREVTLENKIEAGKDVFMIACSRCHSTTGMNGVLEKFAIMYGADKPWDDGAMTSFMANMHQTRTFMPPFPGNTSEAEALVAYLQDLRKHREPLEGAQTAGIRLAKLTMQPVVASPIAFDTAIAEGKDAAPAVDPKMIETGKAVYAQTCVACHQPTGLGVPGAFPPLKDSDWVMAEDPERLIRVLLHGLMGPIEVNGIPYSSAMPGQGMTLKDEQIAAVLSYIRHEWGHGASPVDAETVKAVREIEGARVTPWTFEELKKFPTNTANAAPN